MIVLGIVLLVLGALLAWLIADPRISQLGYAVAVIGVILIVLGVVLLAVDDNGHDLNALLPAFGLGGLRRLKMTR